MIARACGLFCREDVTCHVNSPKLVDSARRVSISRVHMLIEGGGSAKGLEHTINLLFNKSTDSTRSDSITRDHDAERSDGRVQMFAAREDGHAHVHDFEPNPSATHLGM